MVFLKLVVLNQDKHIDCQGCAIFKSLFPQAYLLKHDESKALKPAALQEELNNILKFNPDFAEAVRHCAPTLFYSFLWTLRQLFFLSFSITWITWTAWEYRTPSFLPIASYIILTVWSCLEMRERATAMRATVGACVMPLLTWRAYTAALDTSEYILLI